MAAYFTLEPEKGFLLNFQQLADEVGGGSVLQADLTKAQTFAEQEINARLGRKWDVSGWSTACPPLISQIAELIGASYAWAIRHGSDSIQAVDPGSFHERANRIMDRLIDGTMDLFDASGNLIAPTLNTLRGDIA